MLDLLRSLSAALAAGRQLAWCRLVETRGSTPQKAGAAMLVYEDGSQAGTLGGGCVEAEVKRRALALVAEDRAEICQFQLDSDYGWDDGLICGGRMQVLVEPIRGGPAADYFARLVEIAGTRQGLTEAVIFDSAGQRARCAGQLPVRRAGSACRSPAWRRTAARRCLLEHSRPLDQPPASLCRAAASPFCPFCRAVGC